LPNDSQRQRGHGRRPVVDPARRVAYHALRAVTADGAYANLALADALGHAHLSGRDAAFATELLFGTCRWQGTWNAVIQAAAGRPLNTLQPAVVDVLSLSTHQLLAMRVPPHAAVAIGVQLARLMIGERVTGLVNAVLRRVAARDLDGWLSELTRGMDPVDALALRRAHPRWIVDAFASVLPPDEVDAALAADNEPATPELVARPGLIERDELLRDGGEPTRFSPWGVVRAGDPAQVPAVRDGRAGVQDEGSQLVCLATIRAWRASLDLVAEAREGAPERLVLDLCAGPGGKAALLRGLVAPLHAYLLANEVQPHRADLVRQALRAYPPGGDEVTSADGRHGPWQPGTFDLVLADVPCTGLGSLRRRPEARWRRTPADLADLAALQRELLDAALAAAKPGGLVAYATCSPHPDETASVVLPAAERAGARVLDTPSLLPEVPNCAADTDARFVQLWPHRHGTDAMFLALLATAPAA
jgi:16S rRNA (cytosine967-C5)-methyltransferase